MPQIDQLADGGALQIGDEIPVERAAGTRKAHGYPLNPPTVSDNGTDAYAGNFGRDVNDGELVVGNFGSANTTTTPTLENTGGSPAGAKTITDRDGNALWAGAINGQHSLEYASGTDTYLLLDPRPTDANVNNAPVARDANGRAKFADPSAAQDAATKTYVDTGDATLETAVDATNGGANNLTEIVFTGIKSDAKNIIVALESVSLSGSDEILIQIGDSGGFETSGYVSVGSDADQSGTTGGTSSTSGFVVSVGGSSLSISGMMTLVRTSSVGWVSSHTVRRATDNLGWGAGVKSLSSELDRVRVTVTGSNTFDSGTINILVE